MYENFIRQRVRQSDLGEVVILNADDNTIESPFHDLQSLPQDVVSKTYIFQIASINYCTSFLKIIFIIRKNVKIVFTGYL